VAYTTARFLSDKSCFFHTAFTSYQHVRFATCTPNLACLSVCHQSGRHQAQCCQFVDARYNFNRTTALLPEETIILLLGNPEASQYEIWKQGGALEIDSITLTRVSLVMGIYKALHTLFEDSEQADTWLHRPNQMFGSKPALISLCSGELEEMYALRKYLVNQIY
jgi:hypothetical protein